MPYLDVYTDMGVANLAASAGAGKYGSIIYTGRGGRPDWKGHYSRRLGVGTPLQVRIVCETTVTSTHASDTFKMVLRTDTADDMDSGGDVNIQGATIGSEPSTGAVEIDINVGDISGDEFTVLKGTVIEFNDVPGTYTVTQGVSIARDSSGTVNITPGIVEGTHNGEAASVVKAGFIEDLWDWQGEMVAGDEVLVPIPLDPIKDYMAIWYNPQVLATETFTAGKIKAFIEPHLG